MNPKPSSWQFTFFSIWTGQALSLAGSSVARFALIWWVTQLTGSATVLATATLVSILPGVLLGPLAGALVDRWNRRVVMMASDALIALASAWLAVLFWQGRMRVEHVYVIMLVRAIGSSFHGPAMVASTSLLVPEAQLARVAGLNQTLNGVLNVVTPPLGALLLAVLPLHGIMALDVLTAAPAILPLLFVHIPQPAARSTGKPGLRSLLADVGAGLRYVWRLSGLFTVFVLSGLITVMIRPAFALIPILVTQHFGGQAMELAWFESAMGVGVLAGGIVLSVWGGFRRRTLTIMAGIVGMGIGLCATSLAPATWLWFALLTMFVCGAMFPVIDGPTVALIQSVVEPGVQGRVFSLLISMSEALSPLSMIVAGPVVERLGIQIWYTVGGLACVVMGLAGLVIPSVVHLEDRQRLSQPSTATG